MTDKTKEPSPSELLAEKVNARRRRSITPARLYREIQHCQEANFLEDDATIKDLLDAIIQDVLRDALDD